MSDDVVRWIWAYDYKQLDYVRVPVYFDTPEHEAPGEEPS